MFSSNQQFATSPPGPDNGSRRSAASLIERWTPATLASVAAVYLMIALGWSAAGRTDLSNSRTAAMMGVLALTLAFATAVIQTQSQSTRSTRVSWGVISGGMAALAAVEIASLHVLLTKSVDLWRPELVSWIQCVGVLGILAGFTANAIDHRIEPQFAAGFTGTVASALMIAAGLLVTLYAIFDISGSRQPAVATILALAMAFAMSSIALSLRRSDAEGSSLAWSGWFLFSGTVATAILLQYLGVARGSPGLLALGRWILPVAALGFVSANIVRQTPAANDNWTFFNNPGTLPMRTGWAPWVATAILIATAITAVASGSRFALDLSIAATAGVLLLIGRQTFLLRAERDVASDLRQSTEELQRIANIDMLTGLPNRAALDRRVAEEFERAVRYEQPLSILFADIDFFKRVNDTLGHAAGDTLLREVAKRLRHTARSIDFVARYGGEEFVVVAPGTWSADALILAERLRTAIGRIDDSPFAELGGITISIGIAGYPEHAEELDMLMGRADRALYRAKTAGRNRTILFAQEPEESS